MVKVKILLIAVLLCVCVLPTGLVRGARVYSVDHEWAQITINQDGTIDLTYNITLTLSSGEDINYFDVGQPKGDFEVGTAIDQYNHTLTTTPNTDESYVTVKFNSALTAGNSIWFTLTTNVGSMIYNDTTNPGNYGMLFAPQWMQEVPVKDVRVQIILPLQESANISEVKTTQNLYNSTSIVDGQWAVYWEKDQISANNADHYSVGVSFPAKYMPDYVPSQGGGDNFPDFSPYLTFIGYGVIVFIIFIFIFFIISLARKMPYASPKISMETLGIRRGLTAVEASYLLDMKPRQIVTEIIYSLLKKRVVWVEATKPSLKLRILSPYENKTGTKENPLRFYEIDFLNSLKPDGSLGEEKLARAVVYLEGAVEEKMRGYSRKDTVDYYRGIVTKAWTQVEQAGTVELASNAYDEQLLWLMLDPNYQTKTKTVFQNRVFQPDPSWFWYWYGYTHYNPHPTYHPNINMPTQSAPAPQIPGADFANNIATSLENTANGFVVNLEKFANSIIPPAPAKTSHQPAKSGSGCACACADCACACACVSCACACAGGGVH